MAHYDVVVCGLGVMGSAALYQLAQRGQRVLGIERFLPGHDHGSSHGATRIIRLGYFEHPSYVPLLKHAYASWRALEAATGRPLLHVTGIAEMGPPGGALVQGTLTSAKLHALPHELLAAAEFMRRFPMFRLPSDYLAVVQPDGGFVAAETSLHVFNELARANGAEIRTGEFIRAIEPRAGGVRIVTDQDIVEAGTVIVSAGPWLRSLVPKPPLPIRVTRQVMAWFAPAKPPIAAGFPVFLIESPHGIHYGLPPDGNGAIKVARHHHADETVDPDDYDRVVSAEDERLIRVVLADHVPAANGRLVDAKTCLYTMTPDGHFILDRLPDFPQVIVASPCSGHGFKFAPVIGEILADLAVDGGTAHDISRFRLTRFGFAGDG